MNCPPRQQTALALLSAVLIALQLVLMQMLAISQWHHFAYLVISTALLGFGTAGTLLALYRNWCLQRYQCLLPQLIFATAASIAALSWLTQPLLGGFDSQLLFFAGEQLLRLFAIILCFLLPFLLGATAIGLLFVRQVEQIGRLYFANLAGSGLGGLLALLLLWLRPVEQLPALLALLTLGAGLLALSASSRSLRLIVAATALLCLASLCFPVPLPLSQYKDLRRALDLPDARLLASTPSPYGRVDALSAPALRYAPGLSLNFGAEVPQVPAVFTNGNFRGAVLPRPETGQNHLLSATSGALPFAISRPSRVLILQAGSGAEVGLALDQGSAEVVAVEEHSALLQLLRQQFSSELSYLFDERAVRIENLTARNFLARDKGRYDLILLPAVGSFGGNLGLFALQEQNSLTLEALSAAWDRLSAHGMLSLTSWIDFPLRAPLRLATSLAELLEQQGLKIQQHLVVLRSWGTVSLCAKKSPLTSGDRERIERFASRHQFDLLFPAADQPGSVRFHSASQDDLAKLLPQALASERRKLIADYPFNLSPTRDDHPFFDQFLRLQNLPQLAELFGSRQLPFLELGYLLAVMTLFQLSLAAVILILLPLSKLGWRQGARCWTLVYFASLGFGFMLVELSLIHRFVLYLGNPIYAAAAVICALLLCSGCGSLLSAKFVLRPKQLSKLCAATAVLLLLYNLFLPPLLQQSIALPLPARALLTLLLVAPAGLIMGCPFPLGLRRLNQRQPGAVPWAWGINGCLSVVSAALAAILAVEFGFAALFWLAAAAYATAAAVSLRH